MNQPRFPLFDSLRAIAALSVVALHLPPQLSAGSRFQPYLLEGGAGVAIFFLISGFLLYRPFAQARFAGSGGVRTGPYAVRRGLRIVPAYWVALTLTVLLVGSSGEAATATDVFSPHGVVAYFGFLQVYDSNTLLGGISAAWSLCIEVTFYAMLPLWALLMRRVRCRSRREFVRSELLGLAALFAVGVAWTSVAAFHTEPSQAVFADVTQIQPWLYVLPGYLDHFALGMGLAVASVALAERPIRPRAVRLVERWPALPWLAAALALYAMAHLVVWFPDSWTTWVIARHELQALLAVALLLPAVFGDPGRGLVRKLLANRVLLWIGLVSYGVYLWHVVVITKLVDWGALDSLGTAGFVAATLALTLVAAAASFYGVERHALRLGRRLSQRRRSQDADIRMRDLGRHERVGAGVP